MTAAIAMMAAPVAANGLGGGEGGSDPCRSGAACVGSGVVTTETVNVKANGDRACLGFASIRGTSYSFTLTGVVKPTGFGVGQLDDGSRADAASHRGPLPDAWHPYGSPAEGLLVDDVNAAWGAAFATHTYSYTVTGTGYPFQVRFTDGEVLFLDHDNSGTISATITGDMSVESRDGLVCEL